VAKTARRLAAAAVVVSPGVFSAPASAASAAATKINKPPVVRALATGGNTLRDKDVSMKDAQRVRSDERKNAPIKDQEDPDEEAEQDDWQEAEVQDRQEKRQKRVTMMTMMRRPTKMKMTSLARKSRRKW